MMKASTCLLVMCAVVGFAVQLKAIPVQDQQARDDSWYWTKPLPPQPRPYLSHETTSQDNYCPASLNGHPFPGTSSRQLSPNILYVYNTPLGQDCAGDIRNVEFCYRRGAYTSVSFTLVILKRFYGFRLQIVKKVELRADPYQDKCGQNVEFWKCCAERAIDPLIIEPGHLYGVAVAQSANVLVSFAGPDRMVPGYTRGMAAGTSIEQAVATISGQPTDTPLAVVRFRPSQDNYCPASIKDESFPGTSSWQLHSSQLYVYNTPLGQGCGGQIQKVEFCYKKGTFPSVAFTLVILKRYSWSLQIVKKVELKANPYQDKCGGDVEHWKCCAERAIDPIIVKPDYLYGVAVATHSDNVPVGFYGRTVLGYTRGMAAGGSIEQAVASIRGQQPTFTTLLAVVRFR